MIYIGIGFIGVLIWHIISEILWKEERKELIDRLHAKNFQEFKYYNEQYQGDLQTLKKLREDEFKKLKKEEAKPVDINTEKFLSELEEDWRPETLDEEAIKRMEVKIESQNNREDSLTR
jgi:hypothetical protein